MTPLFVRPAPPVEREMPTQTPSVALTLHEFVTFNVDPPSTKRLAEPDRTIPPPLTTSSVLAGVISRVPELNP
jgi:hypothetical protein